MMFYGKRQTVGRHLPFAVLSSYASASRTPVSSRSLFSWTGLFSKFLPIHLSEIRLAF